MNRFPLLCLLLASTSVVTAQDTNGVFEELDAKVGKQLSSNLWHPASIACIRTQWHEFKLAHEKPGQRGDFYGATCYGGFLCDAVIEDIKQYGGPYNFKLEPGVALSPGPHLQIAVSPDNRVFVVENGCRMPAVVNNKIIFYTNGELVKEKAQLGSKPYARLKLQMIYKARYFGYVIGPVDSFADEMLRLVKEDEKASKTKWPE